MINNFTKLFQLTRSFDAHTDEIYLRQKGYEIDQFIYYWDTIDYDTKFIIADHISDEKSEADGKRLMRKLKNNLKEPPHRIHTDNSYDYPRAIPWTFRYRKRHPRPSPIMESTCMNMVGCLDTPTKGHEKWIVSTER